MKFSTTMDSLCKFLLVQILIYAGSNVHGSVIINGEIASDDSMLYMASVQNKDRHVCGGFLINREYVVTAAHCDLSLTHVILGQHNIKSNDVLRVPIARTCKHRDYKSVGSGHDIMLLKLEENVPLGRRTQTIPLPWAHMKLDSNELCSVAGWGKTESGDFSDELRVVNVSVISNDHCRREWPDLPSNVICAGGDPSTKGFCQGDSGGPLVCGGKAVGVVSFNKNTNCNYPDVPNVYTDVRYYHSWIIEVVKNNICPI